MEYVYLVASLPSLELDGRPAHHLPRSCSLSSDGVLRRDHWEDLTRHRSRTGRTTCAPRRLAYFVDAETQLRNALARLRAAARRRRGRDAGCARTRRLRRALRDRGRAGHGSSRTRWSASSSSTAFAGRCSTSSRRCPPFGVQAVFAYALQAAARREVGGARPSSRRARASRSRSSRSNLAGSRRMSTRSRPRHGRQRQPGHRRVRRRRAARTRSPTSPARRRAPHGRGHPRARPLRRHAGLREHRRPQGRRRGRVHRASCSPWSSGPGLLAQIYDGLQNPLPQLAERRGFFLPRGEQIEALPRDQAWEFTPRGRRRRPRARRRHARRRSRRASSSTASWCRSRLPGQLHGRRDRRRPASTPSTDRIAVLRGRRRRASRRGHDAALAGQAARSAATPSGCGPTEPLVTKMRIIDTFFPVARGGTYCIPGPFGAGKTVLQQITSRHADVDIVIIAACGERAGEVVETLREFPELTDPRTGRSLMERTRHHLQHQLHAGGGPRGLGLHRRHHRRVLPADGPERAAAGRLHLALGAGPARDVRPPGGDPRRGGVPGLPRVGHRRLLRAGGVVRLQRRRASAR